MTLKNTTPRLFVTDYASYNEGKQFEHGTWVDLEDFDNVEEFNEWLTEHFKEAGIEDPEIMFTDFADFPKKYYSESYSGEDLEELFEALPILDAVEGMSDDKLVSLHNQYCSEEDNPYDQIFEFDDGFFDTYFQGKPMEAARAASFGNVNWSDEYIMFNGYGNLESISKHSVKEHIDIDAITEAVIKNPGNYNL